MTLYIEFESYYLSPVLEFTSEMMFLGFALLPSLLGGASKYEYGGQREAMISWLLRLGNEINYSTLSSSVNVGRFELKKKAGNVHIYFFIFHSQYFKYLKGRNVSGLTLKNYICSSFIQYFEKQPIFLEEREGLVNKPFLAYLIYLYK